MPDNRPGEDTQPVRLPLPSDSGSAPTIDPCIPATEPTASVLPERLGRFVIRGFLGAGAFGTVYRAYDPQLEREVALKVARSIGQTPERIQRFRREARAAAGLRHPNIVPLFEAGEADGHLYLAAAYVPGMTLEEVLEKQQGRPFAAEQAAVVVRKLADALAYAHSQGVLHRDVKSANVLLDPAGEPHLLDFGLARRVEDQERMTVAGAVLGTAAYLAPEAAKGDQSRWTPAVDQYALGVVLYELLTGHTPFTGPIELVLALHQTQEPERPSRQHREVPRDLDAICLKCLEKEPAKRYPNAVDLAEDLARFERGEPVRARRVGGAERTWRWCRRNPFVAAWATSAAVLLILATVSAAGAAFLSMAKADAEKRARTRLEEQQTKLEEQQYDNFIAVAERELTLNQDVGLASSLLEKCPPHLRGWEWDYLMRLRDGGRPPLGSSPAIGVRPAVQGTKGGHDAGLFMAVFSPDGKRVATASIDGTVKVWEASSGRVLFTFTGHALAFSFLPGIPRIPVMCLAFSPDGRHIASGSFDPKLDNLAKSPGVVKIWDVENGREILTFQNQLGMVLALTYSPDGRRIASSSINAENTFVVWDAKTGAVVKVVPGHQSNVHRLRFSPDGRLLASCDTDGKIKMWDPAAGFQEIRSIQAHPAPVLDLAFAPGGACFASAGQDGTIRMWETATGVRTLTLQGHTGSALGVAFSPDGKRIASAGYDKTVRLWDAANGKLKLTLRGHYDMVWSVAFSRDGRQLVSASFDSTARIWDAASRDELVGPGLFTVTGHTDRVNSVAFSRDGRYLASGGWDRTVRLWNARTGEALHSLEGHTGPVWCVAFSPDGTRLASASWDKTVKVWDTRTGSELLTFTGHKAMTHCVAFSPDGKYVASGSLDSSTKIWEAATGKVKLTREGGLFSPVASVAFSPDGKRVASGSTNRTVTIWDADTGKGFFTLKGHAGAIPSLAFSSDGKRLVSAGWDYNLKVWDVDPKRKMGFFQSRELLTLKGHDDQVNGVAFSPDGSRIASAGEDKTVRIWDAATGKEVQPPRYHRGVVWSVSYSPDGKRVAAGCWSPSGWVKTWNVER